MRIRARNVLEAVVFNWLFKCDRCPEEEEGGRRGSLVLDAHARRISNREALQRVGRCGCFYCLAIFEPQEIEGWIEDEGGDTALCPRCGIDSVLPESDECPLTKSFLRRMYDHWL